MDEYIVISLNTDFMSSLLGSLFSPSPLRTFDNLTDAINFIQNLPPAPPNIQRVVVLKQTDAQTMNPKTVRIVHVQ